MSTQAGRWKPVYIEWRENHAPTHTPLWMWEEPEGTEVLLPRGDWLVSVRPYNREVELSAWIVSRVAEKSGGIAEIGEIGWERLSRRFSYSDLPNEYISLGDCEGLGIKLD